MRRNGEAAGEVEGGDLRTFSVSAEGDDRTLEGSPGEDPPQSYGKLDQRHSPRHSSPRNLLVLSLSLSLSLSSTYNSIFGDFRSGDYVIVLRSGYYLSLRQMELGFFICEDVAL